MGSFVSTFKLVEDFLRTVGGYAQIHRAPPSNLATALPLHVVSRFGGTDRIVTVYDARIDVDTFASSEDAAERIGEQVRTLIRVHLSGRLFEGATVVRARTVSAPALIPWDVGDGSNGTQLPADVFRVSAAYELRIHQYTGVS